jgi:hypothetical protein
VSQHFFSDLSRLRYPRSVPSGVATRRVPRHRPGDQFLKGPIPWSWLTRAANLGRAPLCIALKVWQLAGIQGTGRFGFSAGRAAREFDLNSRSGQRALGALAHAGLLRTEPRRGRKAIVEILLPDEVVVRQTVPAAQEGVPQ